MKVTITLNGNSFEADGEFTLDDRFMTAFRSWMNAQQTNGHSEKIDALTERLKAANDTHAAVVTANTPTSPGA